MNEEALIRVTDWLVGEAGNLPDPEDQEEAPQVLRWALTEALESGVSALRLERALLDSETLLEFTVRVSDIAHAVNCPPEGCGLSCCFFLGFDQVTPWDTGQLVRKCRRKYGWRMSLALFYLYREEIGRSHLAPTMRMAQ